MNLNEFAALKPGDKIENRMSVTTKGTVTEAADGGVYVVWEGNAARPFFFFSVQSTAWFHWSKVDAP